MKKRIKFDLWGTADRAIYAAVFIVLIFAIGLALEPPVEVSESELGAPADVLTSLELNGAFAPEEQPLPAPVLGGNLWTAFQSLLAELGFARDRCIPYSSEFVGSTCYKQSRSLVGIADEGAYPKIIGDEIHIIGYSTPKGNEQEARNAAIFIEAELKGLSGWDAVHQGTYRPGAKSFNVYHLENGRSVASGLYKIPSYKFDKNVWAGLVERYGKIYGVIKVAGVVEDKSSDISRGTSSGIVEYEFDDKEAYDIMYNLVTEYPFLKTAENFEKIDSKGVKDGKISLKEARFVDDAIRLASAK